MNKAFFCIEEPIDEVKNSLRKLKKSGFTNIFSNVLRAKLVSSSSEEYWGYSDLHLVLLGSYLWCFARAFVSFYLFFPYFFALLLWNHNVIRIQKNKIIANIAILVPKLSFFQLFSGLFSMLLQPIISL